MKNRVWLHIAQINVCYLVKYYLLLQYKGPQRTIQFIYNGVYWLNCRESAGKIAFCGQIFGIWFYLGRPIQNYKQQMYNSIQTESESSIFRPQLDQRRLQLEESIATYKRKISQWKDFDSEISAVISHLSSQPRPKKEQSGFERTQKTAQTRKSSNQKIKQYELEKKLAQKNKQNKEMHHSTLKLLEEQEQLYASLDDLRQLINRQSVDRERLQHQQQQLEHNRLRILSKGDELQQLLNQEQQTLSFYEVDKKSKINNIKRYKQLLKRSSDITETDEGVSLCDLTMSQDKKIEQVGNCIYQSNYSEDRLISRLLSDDKSEEENLLLDSGTREQTANESQNLPNCQSKIGRVGLTMGKTISVEELYESISIQEKRAITLKQRYIRCLNARSIVKKNNRNLQASSKHARVTVNLLTQRQEGMMKNIEKNENECHKAINDAQQLHQMVQELEGESGQLRGKLGIKVENNRLLSLINESMEIDFDRLFNCLQKLSQLKTDAHTLVDF